MWSRGGKAWFRVRFLDLFWDRENLAIQGGDFYYLRQLAFEPSDEVRTVEANGRIVMRYHIKIVNSKQPLCAVTVPEDQQDDFMKFQNALINSKLSRSYKRYRHSILRKCNTLIRKNFFRHSTAYDTFIVTSVISWTLSSGNDTDGGREVYVGLQK